MFSLFKAKQPKMVAVDISASAVKVLGLARVGDRLRAEGDCFRVESYGVSPLPTDAVVEKNIKKPEAVTESLRDAISKSKTDLRHAAIAVSDASVISKVVQVDRDLTEEAIENQIAIEADKFIPYSLDEVSLDFDIIGPNLKNSDYIDVLVAASRTQNVQSRTSVLEDAGLNVRIVDVESYAVERACSLLADVLPEKGINQTVAVIDIGSRMTTMTILYNLATVFSREESFGGHQLTEEIQRHYGLSYAEAGLAKKTGNLPEDYERVVLNPYKESVVMQVRRALQIFFSGSNHNKVEQLILAGGTTTIPGLPELLQTQLGIPAMIVNPFKNMQIAEQVDRAALESDAASLLLCCGLAMRGVSTDDEY